MVVMAQIPSLDAILSWIPEESQHKLYEPIEYKSLARISDHILEWDGAVADELSLSKIDRHDISVGNREPRQQRRAAFSRWQERFGSQATYRHLIVAFHKAQKMDYVEVVCNQLGAKYPPATPTTPTLRTLSGSESRSLGSLKSGLTFADYLSPVQLTEWLTQELESKGLTLEESQRKSLLDEDINGKAFRELTDEELKDLGFKLGARKNIKGIISSISNLGPLSSPPPPLPSASTGACVRDPSLTAQALDTELASLVYWYTLGIKLGLPSHELDIIQKDYQGVKNQKVALYSLWLESDTCASWSRLCDALSQEGKKVLAEQIKHKFVTGKSATTNEDKRQRIATSRSSSGVSSSQGSKVTEAALLECLQGCSDEDVKSVGVALGINRARLDGHSRGQRLAEVVARLYAEGVDACREMRWVDLSSALVDAGESELAKRIEVNRNNIENPSIFSNATEHH